MPSPKKTPGKGKQPTIRQALTGTQKRRIRRIADSSDDESEADVDDDAHVDVAAPVPATKPRGRPRKAPQAAAVPLFDESNPEVNFGMYNSKSKEHVPLVWLHSVADYLDEYTTLHDTSTERGKKEDWLHIQSVFGAHILTDAATLKRFVTEIKGVIGVHWGDGSGCKVQVKPLTFGQTLCRMIGYVRKDRNMVHFHNRNKNITPDMIAEGIAEHESLTLSYLDGKILLTKSNIFMKVWQFWQNYHAPAVVSFSRVLTDMLNTKPQQYSVSATLLMNSNGQMRRSAAEVYWLHVMGQAVTEYEVRHIIFLPKGGFEGPDYVPTEFCDVRPKHSMFGESDEEDEAAASGDAAESGEAAGSQ